MTENLFRLLTIGCGILLSIITSLTIQPQHIPIILGVLGFSLLLHHDTIMNMYEVMKK